MPADPPVLDTTALAAMFQPMSRWVVERGKAVETARRDLGWSRAELARRCDLSIPTIWRIEVGHAVPSDRVRVLIAHHLGTTAEALWRLPTAAEVDAYAGPDPLDVDAGTDR